MKHLYTLLLIFFLSSAAAQQVPGQGDIQGFKLFPNPVTEGKISIVTASNAPKKIHIYDVLGTPVLQTTLMGRELNLSQLRAGVYLIQVFEKDRVAIRKLIVK